MDHKKLFKKLVSPPLWLIIILAVFSTASLIYVFVKGLEEAVFAYFVYVISFYTLSVIVIFFTLDFPKRYRAIKKAVYNNPIGKMYMTDREFRNRVSLYSSLTINLLYVGLNILSAYFYHTYWFTILAFYYGILAVMRFLLVRYIRKNKLGSMRMRELKISRACAFILTTINLVLTGAVLMILYQNKGFSYNGILIYVMAAYTFFVTTTAVIDLIKYRKSNESILLTSKAIKLAAALVSMLSLETAMFSQFGKDMSINEQNIMIAATGAGVSVIIIMMAIYIIIRVNKEIKILRSTENYG